MKSENFKVPQEGRIRIVVNLSSFYQYVLKRKRQAWKDWLQFTHFVTKWLCVIGFGPFEAATVCAALRSYLCFANHFLSYFSLQYSRERSSVCQRKCQKKHHQHLSFWMLGQNNPYHKQRRRCLRQKVRNTALYSAGSHQRLCKNGGKTTSRFLFDASCLYLFYYYV